MSALTTSLPRFLLLLLLLTVPRQGGCLEEERDLEGEDSDSPDDYEEDEAFNPVSIKYMVLWDEAPPLPARSSSSWADFNSDIDSVNCTSDLNCTAALYDLDVALSYDSNLPSAPYCINPNGNESDAFEVGQCTCGPDKCVSYSRDYYNGGSTFYYCGPCGWVGSRCDERPCTHPLAECGDNSFCECVKGGKFYDLSYCYIPYFGKRLALEMLIATAIIVLCCAILAYGYTRIGRRRSSNAADYLDRWSRGSITRESSADDTPPTYDDVVDKLPTYQDALEMNTKGGEDGGITNLSFEPDFEALPTYLEASSVGEGVKITPAATHTPTANHTLAPIRTSLDTTAPTESTNITEQKNLTEAKLGTSNLNLESSDELQGFTDAILTTDGSMKTDDSTTPLPQPIQQPLQAAIIDMQTNTPARPLQTSDRIDLQTNTMFSSYPVASESFDMSHLDTKDQTTV